MTTTTMDAITDTHDKNKKDDAAAMPPAQVSPFPYTPINGTGTTSTSTSTKKRKAPPVAAAAANKKAAVAVSTSNQKQSTPTSSSPESRQAPPAASTKPVPKVRLVTLEELQRPPAHVIWETRYQELLHFQKGHGHCRVTVRNATEMPGLSTWVYRQRAAHQDCVARLQQEQQLRDGETVTDDNDYSTIPPERFAQFEMLNQLGFHWVVMGPVPPFEERFQELVAFKEEYGHCRVKRSHSLGEWVHHLRREYKKTGRLSVPERVDSLLELGFEFSVATVMSWEQRLEQLMDFRRKYGHVNVFEVNRQALEENVIAGIINNHEDEDNDNHVTKGKAGTAGSTKFIDNTFLRWVETQQRAYWTFFKLGKKCQLNKVRIKQLEDMGFDFGPERHTHAKGRMGAHKVTDHGRTNNTAFSSRVAQLRDYKARHGDCLVPKVWKENPQLGSWVANQRKQHRALLSGKPTSLTKQRRAELDSMGFVWVVRPWNLKENRKNKGGPQQDDATTSSGEDNEMI
jgi:hypothetical protein